MQPSIPWSSGSVFVTGRMAVIHFLKGSVFILIGEFALATHVYFQKMLVPTMRPFKGTTIIYTEYTRNHALFQRYCTLYLQMLKFAAIQFYQHPFFQRISEHQSPWNKFLIKAVVFSEQHRLYQNESSHLKHIFFRRIIFFKIPTCLE